MSVPTNVQVVIPSMGRADRVTTLKLVPDALVCVPESEAHAYAEHCPNLLVHPDKIKGLLPKRNWILRKFKDRPLLMLDDDLSSLSRLFQKPGAATAPQKVETAGMVREIIENTARMAGEAGAYLFGWEPSSSGVLVYSGLKPFGFTGYINCTAIGFLPGHGLEFDERLTAKGDYDICLQNALKHRFLFKDRRYAWSAKSTFSATGGAAAQRSLATERKDIKLLKRKWGDVVRTRRQVSGTRKKLYSGGMEQIVLRLPF